MAKDKLIIPQERMYKKEEEVTLRFYQMPKVLFGNERYKGLSLAAKAMYSILRDRQELSIKNNWVDENGYIYLVFDINKLAELIEMDRTTVMKYKKELIKYGLLIDKRLGQGKANRLYILKPELPSEEVETLDIPEKSKKPTSRSREKSLQEVGKTDTNDTELSDTVFNDLKQEEEEEIIYTSQQTIFERLSDFLNIDPRMRRKILLRIGELNEYTPDGLYNTFKVLRDRLDAIAEGKKQPIEHLPAWFLETLEGEDTKILMLDAAQKRVLRQKQQEEEKARARRENAVPFPFYNWLEEDGE